MLKYVERWNSGRLMLQVFQLFQRKCECSFNIILAYFNIFHHSISTSFNRISTSFIIQISTYFNIISTSFIIQISTSFNIISTSFIIKNLNIFQHYFNMVTWLVSQVGWVTWLVSPGVAAAGCAGGFGAAVVGPAACSITCGVDCAALSRDAKTSRPSERAASAAAEETEHRG